MADNGVGSAYPCIRNEGKESSRRHGGAASVAAARQQLAANTICMASSLMHLAAATRLTGQIKNPGLFYLGCVLVDACGQAGHYRAKADDGRRYYDLERFRAEHGQRLQTDDFCLGYYMHIVQDMVYRKFVYADHGWNPRSPGNVERLYNDYRLLNPVLVRKYGLRPLRMPQDAVRPPLMPANAAEFVASMEAQFAPYDEGEPFFLTEALADAFVERAADVCLQELRALRGEGAHVDPRDYAYTHGFQIREMAPDEYPLLRDFLYEAIFQRDENNLLPRGVVDNPELRIYIEDFGRKPQDCALCAELDGRVIGAVWVRDIPAYGHVADGVPEFAVSVLKEHRGQGVGSRMMREMLRHLQAIGCPRASLAVQKDNYALRMYQKCGFQIIGENDQEYIMDIRFV